MRGVAANDNPASGSRTGGGAEARVDAALVTLAGLIGRRIARGTGQARRRQRQRAGEGRRRETGELRPSERGDALQGLGICERGETVMPSSLHCPSCGRTPGGGAQRRIYCDNRRRALVQTMCTRPSNGERMPLDSQAEPRPDDRTDARRTRCLDGLLRNEAENPHHSSGSRA